jgi:glycosyltransferase involved in cell wall biosynthesis
LRILHIDTGTEMRGGQRQVELLMSGLSEAGHECRLLAPRGSPLGEAAAKAGYAVRSAEAKELFQESKRAALVHAHDARAHTLAAIASRRRFVVSRRVAFPVRRSVASHWKYQRARRFLAVSRFVADQLQLAGVRKDKIDVVYDGVAAQSPAHDWSPEHPAVALASSDPQKGRDLVEAAARIAEMTIVFSDDLPRDLQQASLFVYITRSEGLGSAALLAMSMGVPVIASAVGGLIEIFSPSECGLLVDNDPRIIARAMRRILTEPDLAAGLIARAKARIGEAFTKQHLVTGTLDSYARALAG